MCPHNGTNGERPTAGQSALVPAIGTASSTAAIRSLGRAGVDVVGASEQSNPPGFDSKYCTHGVTVPDPAEDMRAYEDALVSLAECDSIGTILPFREPDVYALARNRGRMSAHVGTPWPDLETLRQVQDRVHLFAAADRAGVATPETAPVDEYDDWDSETIVKPRYTMQAPEYDDQFDEPAVQESSTHYVPPGERPDSEELVETVGHVPLAQEFVPTTAEYAFFALYDEGEAVATFQHRQRRGWKYDGGPSAFRESVEEPELASAGRVLLDELDWHGVAMVEFLRDPETGEFRLMEINPRFWSSLPFTVRAGVDFPLLYWAQAMGQPPVGNPEYEVGIAGHLLRGELLYLHSIHSEDNPLVDRPSLAGETATVGRSLLEHRQFDYLSVDDPRPFIREVRNTVSGTLGRGESA